jgi:hypothetical protein
MVMTQTRKTARAVSLYRNAEKHIRAAGFGWELDWQRRRSFEALTEQDLLRESAWVVLCSGFREAIVRNVFDYISLCFCDWESAAEISRHQRTCIDTAAWGFSNRRKLQAIASIADLIHDHGFETLRNQLSEDPISRLQIFPFIGPTTSWHLAKNIGFNVAKNDRHLARLALLHGFSDAHALCELIAETTGEPLSVIDIVLWRFATLNPQPQLPQLDTGSRKSPIGAVVKI